MTRFTAMALGIIATIYLACSLIGITWGLPSRNSDKYLFGKQTPWTGEKIYRLAHADKKFDATRGADVDPDPIDKSSGQLIHLTKTDSDIAKIYLRYRLFTHQPDEMITMMALAGMKPGKLEFDPKLYQYGGLFIYPVGALIKLCGIVGLIEVRGDVVYYLDHPDEFGKFYIVARAYAAAWGLLGLFVIFAIARRISSDAAGIFAAALFAMMPVVVCMSHEGKPHLPGAVLMLCAVYFAMRALRPTRWSWWLMCICCGAAVGMVLSSTPILILIPLVCFIQYAGLVDNQDDSDKRPAITLSDAAKRSFSGVMVAITIYLITNPYILINAFTNRAVLRSNFGNSLAMYDISRIGEGFIRVMELTAEGATWIVVLGGVMAMIAGFYRKRWVAWPLIVSAGVFFLQFVLIGAGKPAEYGRFGIFTNSALVIGMGCIVPYILCMRARSLTISFILLVIINVGIYGSIYLRHFYADTTESNSRIQLAKILSNDANAYIPRGKPWGIALLAEPAPYNCPPLNFSQVDVVLCPPGTPISAYNDNYPPSSLYVLDSTIERHRAIYINPGSKVLASSWRFVPPKEFVMNHKDSPISWADKTFILCYQDRMDN